MKYIKVKSEYGEPVIVFPDFVEHAEVARGFDKVLSAGFVLTALDGKIYAGDESVSLKLKPEHPDDDILLEILLREVK